MVKYSGFMGAHKQEQEPAATEVVEVAPSVLRMQLPISMPGLGHVNTYALLDDRGAALVDPGLPGPSSWKALKGRLASAGLKVRDVHTVVVTHSHPDHFGGAAQLAKEAGAEIVAHAAFRNWWRGTEDEAAEEAVIDDVDPEDLPARAPGTATRGGPPFGQPTPWGGKGFTAPLHRRVMLRLFRGRLARSFGPPEVSRALRHGDEITLGGRPWRAVHTPGHTLDHLCLHDEENGVLLSGDHVLPTITPHIPGMNAGRDPLALFLDSLDRVDSLGDVSQVLPAHGHPFPDLNGRIAAIRKHHDERLAKLREIASAVGPTTVEEYSHHLFRERSWGTMAESETYAHLEHLRLAGEADRYERDGLMIYDIVGAAGS